MKHPFFTTHFQKGGFGLLFALAFALICGCTQENSNDEGNEKRKPSFSIFATDKEDDCEDIDVSNTVETVKITRLEDELMQLRSKEEAETLLKKHPSVAKYYFAEEHYPKGVLAERLFKLAQDTAIQALYKQTKAVYQDVSDLEKQFADAFAHVKYYYPKFKSPKIYTVISGLAIERVLNDSVIVLSLDFFLGEKAKYKPISPDGTFYPEYILKRYKKPYLVPACILYISDKYNKTDMLDNTVLADMIAAGKAYYFTKKMMPCIHDTLIIGYTGTQLKDAKSHESLIWGFLIQNKALYETSHIIKTKYTGERPYTAEIGPRCPGKIGTWVGWEIVKKYMHGGAVTLQQLMENKDAKKLLIDSKYKPEAKKP